MIAISTDEVVLLTKKQYVQILLERVENLENDYNVMFIKMNKLNNERIQYLYREITLKNEIKAKDELISKLQRKNIIRRTFNGVKKKFSLFKK